MINILNTIYDFTGAAFVLFGPLLFILRMTRGEKKSIRRALGAATIISSIAIDIWLANPTGLNNALFAGAVVFDLLTAIHILIAELGCEWPYKLPPAPSANYQRRTDSSTNDDGDFLTSALVANATRSAITGYAVGGSALGAWAGKNSGSLW